MTPLSRLRELSARSTQLKEFADKEKEYPTVAPVTRSAITGALAGYGLGALGGGALVGGSAMALGKILPRKFVQSVRPLRPLLKPVGIPYTTRGVAGTVGLAVGHHVGKKAALVGGIGGALAGARIKGRDEERFKNKEFGLLTKNEPAFDKDGTFTGVENHYNGPGIAEAAGGAAVLGAGLGAGHVGIMKKYGTETIRREKGRFISPKTVKRTTAGAYKAAGSDAIDALKRVVGKRFSAKDRLKELAGGYAMKEGDKSTIYKEPGVKGHLKRHAGLYISAPLALPSAGIASVIGAIADSARAGGSLVKTHVDSINPLVQKLPKNSKARPSHRIHHEGNGVVKYYPMFSAKDRLRELAAVSTSLKSFDQKVDENGHPILDAAAGAGLGAGLGAGAVLGHQAIMKNYGNFVDANRTAGAYGRAASDFKGGFSKVFNPPSTGEGAGSVATAATNSPLSHDGASVGGAAKVAEAGEEAAKLSPLAKAGARVGGLGASIRGFLSKVR